MCALRYTTPSCGLRMTEQDPAELLEEVEGVDDPSWSSHTVLIPLGASLSLLSCGVVATAMLASDLRKESWAMYLILWATAEAVLQLEVIVNIIVGQVFSDGDASTLGCHLYFYLYHVMNLTSVTSVVALSVHRLISRARGSLCMGVALLLAASVLHSPIVAMAITDATYHHLGGYMCAVKAMDSSSRLFTEYLHVVLLVTHVVGPLLVCGAVVGFCLRRHLQALRLLTPFLLAFVVLRLPSAIFFTLVFLYHYFELPKWIFEGTDDIFHVMAYICYLTEPIVLLGCLTTSADFRRALRNVLPSPLNKTASDSQVFMTEMTEVEEGEEEHT